MSNKILILGESGTGKSTSLRNLNSNETYIIQVVRKDLPFRGWKGKYNEKNLAVVNTVKKIEGYLSNISEKAPHIKTVIIDDFQYLMSGEYMRRAKETGFQKFTDIGKNAYDILMYPDNLRDDLTVIFLYKKV